MTTNPQPQPQLDFRSMLVTVCCREWWVAFGEPWGRCGFCHTKPVSLGAITSLPAKPPPPRRLSDRVTRLT